MTSEQKAEASKTDLGEFIENTASILRKLGQAKERVPARERAIAASANLYLREREKRPTNPLTIMALSAARIYRVDYDYLYGSKLPILSVLSDRSQAGVSYFDNQRFGFLTGEDLGYKDGLGRDSWYITLYNHKGVYFVPIEHLKEIKVKVD